MKQRAVFEADVIDGIEPFAIEELKKSGAKFISEKPIRFYFGKSQTRLVNLRIVTQVYGVHTFDIPRPKALLGQQHFDRLFAILQNHVGGMGPQGINSFRLEAAGKESAVFQRIISQLQNRLKLPHQPEGGDLFLRVKPASDKRKGWEVLVRLTPRPLAARDWRTFNYPGALAAPLAVVMHRLAAVQPRTKLLNIMSGSGTLLAEAAQDDLYLVGCDLNFEALRGSLANIQNQDKRADLQQANAIQLPYKNGVFDTILADLPWGQLIGDSVKMDELYAGVLQEAWRVAKEDGRFVVITQLKKRFLQALDKTAWRLVETVPVRHQKVNPDIYLLKK